MALNTPRDVDSSAQSAENSVLSPLGIQRQTFEIALDYLRELTGKLDSQFQDGQWQAIDSLVNHRRKVLLVQRTGWGKSAVYFIATKLLRNAGVGPTLIISPLVALMRNQTSAGKAMGLNIETLNSETSGRIHEYVQMTRADRLDALLIAPEQLRSRAFRDQLLPLILPRMGLLVIDEAHCISEWGHDFRPDYQRVRQIVSRLPRNTALVATTATATDRVVEDLEATLGETSIVRGPLLRNNLGLHVIPDMNSARRLAWIANYLRSVEGSTLVYVLKVADAEHVANWLCTNGLKAESYHGQHPPDARKSIEERFTNGTTSILVTTSALSLGYDNARVLHVIHYEAPNSPLAYYQEVGRAGRSTAHAVGILMQANSSDAEFHKWAREHAMPKPGIVAQILDCMERTDYCTTSQLARDLNFEEHLVASSLNILVVQTPAPVANDGEVWFRTPVPFQLDVYQSVFDSRRRIREQEWAEIWNYRQNRSLCRMAFLLKAFSSVPEGFRCGKCDVCTGSAPLMMSLSPGLIEAAERFHYAIHPELVPLPTRNDVSLNALAITRYDDSQLKHLVQAAKYQRNRDPRLLELTCQALDAANWPDPAPRWVTSVPSSSNPGFVRWVARGIARHLQLPFHEVVLKSRTTEPQKNQRNPLRQRENVRDAFAISQSIPSGPVLVVDDMVDSGETLAEVCSVLRQHGCAHTHPFALAITSSKRTR